MDSHTFAGGQDRRVYRATTTAPVNIAVIKYVRILYVSTRPH